MKSTLQIIPFTTNQFQNQQSLKCKSLISMEQCFPFFAKRIAWKMWVDDLHCVGSSGWVLIAWVWLAGVGFTAGCCWSGFIHRGGVLAGFVEGCCCSDFAWLLGSQIATLLLLVVLVAARSGDDWSWGLLPCQFWSVRWWLLDRCVSSADCTSFNFRDFFLRRNANYEEICAIRTKKKKNDLQIFLFKNESC